jgi:hypothetical protein
MLRRQKKAFSIAAAGAAAVESKIFLVGRVGLFIIDIPNYTNAETITLSMVNGDGRNCYTKAALAKNKTGATAHAEQPAYPLPVVGSYTLSILPSGVTGDAISIVVEVYTY